MEANDEVGEHLHVLVEEIEEELIALLIRIFDFGVFKVTTTNCVSQSVISKIYEFHTYRAAIHP